MAISVSYLPACPFDDGTRCSCNNSVITLVDITNHKLLIFRSDASAIDVRLYGSCRRATVTRCKQHVHVMQRKGQQLARSPELLFVTSDVSLCVL